MHVRALWHGSDPDASHDCESDEPTAVAVGSGGSEESAAVTGERLLPLLTQGTTLRLLSLVSDVQAGSFCRSAGATAASPTDFAATYNNTPRYAPQPLPSLRHRSSPPTFSARRVKVAGRVVSVTVPSAPAWRPQPRPGESRTPSRAASRGGLCCVGTSVGAGTAAPPAPAATDPRAGLAHRLLDLQVKLEKGAITEERSTLHRELDRNGTVVLDGPVSRSGCGPNLIATFWDTR